MDIAMIHVGETVAFRTPRQKATGKPRTGVVASLSGRGRPNRIYRVTMECGTVTTADLVLGCAPPVEVAA